MNSGRLLAISLSLAIAAGQLLGPAPSVAVDPVVAEFDTYLARFPDGESLFSFDHSDYEGAPGELAGYPIGVFDSGIGGLTVLDAILTSDLFDNQTREPGPDGRPVCAPARS